MIPKQLKKYGTSALITSSLEKFRPVTVPMHSFSSFLIGCFKVFVSIPDSPVKVNVFRECSENFLFFSAQDVNHAAHLIENFFQALWYDHAHTTARSAVETDINDVRPKFRNVLKVYEVVQTAADRVVYGPDAQHAKSRAASLFDNAPEIVLVVNVVGPWASVGIVTFWSILRHRTT